MAKNIRSSFTASTISDRLECLADKGCSEDEIVDFCLDEQKKLIEKDMPVINRSPAAYYEKTHEMNDFAFKLADIIKTLYMGVIGYPDDAFDLPEMPYWYLSLFVDKHPQISALLGQMTISLYNMEITNNDDEITARMGRTADRIAEFIMQHTDENTVIHIDGNTESFSGSLRLAACGDPAAAQTAVYDAACYCMTHGCTLVTANAHFDDMDQPAVFAFCSTLLEADDGDIDMVPFHDPQELDDEYGDMYSGCKAVIPEETYKLM